MPKIIERFALPQRGTVIVLDTQLDMPPKQDLRAVLQQDDGTQRAFVARKEWIYRSGNPADIEAFLLRDAGVMDIREGAEIEIIIVSPVESGS